MPLYVVPKFYEMWMGIICSTDKRVIILNCKIYTNFSRTFIKSPIICISHPENKAPALGVSHRCMILFRSAIIAFHSLIHPFNEPSFIPTPRFFNFFKQRLFILTIFKRTYPCLIVIPRSIMHKPDMHIKKAKF